jgi:hypothetical protein
LVDAVVGTRHLQDRVVTSLREAGGNAAVAKRCAQELALDAARVGAVIAAVARLGLEVDSRELARCSAVAGRQDAPGAYVDLTLHLVVPVEPLVEEAELVAGAHGAREVDIPGEDFREVVR